MKTLFVLLALSFAVSGCVVAPGQGYGGYRGERVVEYRQGPVYRPGPVEYRRFDR